FAPHSRGRSSHSSAARRPARPSGRSCALCLSCLPVIGVEGGSADSSVEVVAEPREGFEGKPRERLELDRRDREPSFPARELGVREESLAKILVREKLAQHSLHCLLSHRRAPPSTSP